MDSRLLAVGREALALARHLGWRVVAVAVDERGLDEARRLKEEGSALGVDVALRLDVSPPTPSKLRDSLRRLRRSVELIGVAPTDISVARAAARDNRVDFLVLSPDPRVKVFDEGVASLMRSSGVILEIDLAPLIRSGAPSGVLRHYLKAYRLARSRRLEVAFASGAEDALEMRAPRDLAALAQLITLNDDEARRSLSEVPLARLEVNRSKLGPDYVMPGVRVVRPEGG